MQVYKEPIQNIDQAMNILSSISQLEFVALDTEFVRRNTYRAKLQLIQFATKQAVFCIDAKRCRNWPKIVEKLCAFPTTCVFHAAFQDLEILHHYKVLPNRVFDTQLAARICGYSQYSYKNLVDQFVGVSIGKNVTRSDWSLRPFTRAQIKYALNDVIYLPKLYRYFQTKLENLGRVEWMNEECDSLVESILTASNQETAWKKFPNGSTLNIADQHIAKKLLIWREKRAMKLDWPRQWILSDSRILQIVLAKPHSIQALRRVLKVKSHRASFWLNEVLSIVNEKLPGDIKVIWKRPNRLTMVQKNLKQRLISELDDIAKHHQISADLICTRIEIQRAVQGRRDCRMFAGWRNAITSDLQKLLTSESSKT